MMPPLPGPLDLAAIGNGRIAALCDTRGRIVWCCYPYLDGDPVFSRLLAGSSETGFAEVELADQVAASSSYRRNTAILETTLEDIRGGRVRIIDFCPRMQRYGRMFHPPMLVRRIELVGGQPRIILRVRPTFEYGAPPNSITVGSNNVRWHGAASVFRLTTDAPLSYVLHETPFILSRPITLVFGPDQAVQGTLDQTAHDFLQRTDAYWIDWVRSLGIPLEWQREVIRAAITLKICSVDETGAVVAALTTSIPEAPRSQRNWDYRYCWPRDAHFVVKALNALGATQTMEAYLGYIANLTRNDDTPMRPVYGIVHDQPLPERAAPSLAGFCGDGPVRIGNAAAEQTQHDTYGSIVLAASHMFIDERLPVPGTAELFQSLERLGDHAIRNALLPDAGPWELRDRRHIHTYSAAMCWVACDRLASIAARLRVADRYRHWRAHAERLQIIVLDRAWSPERRAFTGNFETGDLDASVLLFAELGLVAAADPRFSATVETIGRELSHNGFIMRYTVADDFGLPDMAFLACQFWYIDALQRIGRHDEARELFEMVLARRNRFGLLSEDIDPASGRLWGNLPQTYSMAGIVNSAMLLSKRWDHVWTTNGTL